MDELASMCNLIRAEALRYTILSSETVMCKFTLLEGLACYKLQSKSLWEAHGQFDHRVRVNQMCRTLQP